MKSLFYPSPLMKAPSVMIVDVPAHRRGETLPLGRYYPIIIETDSERDEVLGALERRLGESASLDLLDHRPSNLWSDRVLISRYDSPAPGWLWVAVTRWPESFRDAGADHGIAMARGCYTMELFASVDELDEHCAALLDGLGSQYPVHVRMLSADMIADQGEA